MDINLKLIQAREAEAAQDFQLAYILYTQILDYALPNKALPAKELEAILDRAEFCKRNLKNTGLLLNLPTGCSYKDEKMKKFQPVKLSIHNQDNQTVLLLDLQGTYIEIYLQYWLCTKVLPPKIAFLFVNQEKFQFELLIDQSKIEQEYISHLVTALKSASFQYVEASPETKAEYLAAGIIYTGDLISSALEPLQKSASKYVTKKSDNYIAQKEAKETPTKINPAVEKTVEYTAKGTGIARDGAAKLIGWIGDQVAETGGKIADKLGPSTKSKNGKETWLGAAGKVAGAGFHAMGSFWNSLEKEGTSFGRNVRGETMRVVTHRHGEQAGKVAGDACKIVVDSTKIGFYYSEIGMKAIAKNTAKSAGKQMLKSK